MFMFVAVCVFIVILLGAYILRTILKENKSPRPVVLIHGVFAVIVIFTLAKLVYTGISDTLLIVALVFFIGAALGGVAMAYLSSKNKPVPKAFLIIHPLVGISGFVILLSYIFKM